MYQPDYQGLFRIRSVPARSRELQAIERLPERVQAERPELQRVAVERLEVEFGPFAGLRVLSRLQPDPLAHLVRRCLPRPPQVTVELEAQELVGHPAVRPQE